MRVSPIFFRYVGRQFLLWFLAVFLALGFLIVLFDMMEMIRRTASRPNITFDVMMSMSFLRLPDTMQRVFPFAVLIGALLAFWRLNRNHELVVARAAGVSAWQFLLPGVVVAFVIGLFYIGMFNPFAAAMLQRYDLLEARYNGGKSNFVDVSENGLWLRQATDTGQYVIHSPQGASTAVELQGVTVFVFEGEARFVLRIDAGSAKLEHGYWLLRNVRLIRPGGQPEQAPEYRLKTDLSPENFSDNFAPPQTISFWALPGFISILEKSGFSALRHRVYWNTRLADPLLFCGMILLAATMSLRLTRRGGTTALLAAGIGVGVAVFFVSDVIFALGAAARIPVELAAWAPASVCCLLGAAAVFHLEDG